jgi:hypothetical protein
VAEAAHRDPDGVCGDRADEWSAASHAARRRVVRMSLELRLVVNVESARADELASATTA